MELYTLDSTFKKVDTIDAFDSAIWTERVYGDGDFELDVPDSTDMRAKLPKGQLMLCEGSIQPMILETRDSKDGLMKTTGISLMQWLNNRIIRTTNDHSIRDWLLSGYVPGQALVQIVENFCILSNYLNGTINIGIPAAHTALFPVPGLQIGASDASGAAVDFSVPFGPVYDALRQIATAYGIGMRIDLVGNHLEFINWKGTDRTSDQNTNPVIEFSPGMDTFTSARDLESVTDYRNYVYMFAPNAPPAVMGNAGSSIVSTPVTGFDLRVFQNYADDIQSDFTGDATTLLSVLNQKAALEAFNHNAVLLVDGEIVQTGQINYGVDYFLGDYIDVEGNSGVVQSARITEYIRSQDATGERSYPTLATS